MWSPQTFTQVPFVYIVDSPSPRDLFEGYSIGMALRDALKALHIPHFYTLAVDKNMFTVALEEKLPNCILQKQTAFLTNAYPFIHLCMHGADEGIALTNGTYMQWPELRTMLFAHNKVKGYDPFVCMASCNGIRAAEMAHAFDSVYNHLIGNLGPVLQADVTVAYLAFYNHLFYKQATVDQAVTAMKAASGDNNFYYAIGQQEKYRKFQALKWPSSNYPPLSI
jgi:hypothetical protein